MKDLQRNQAIMSRLEDTNWSKKMTDRVLQSQIANQENSISGNQSTRIRRGWGDRTKKIAMAAIIFLGLGMGIGIFQLEKNNQTNESASSQLASIDTAMLVDIYWEKDEWEEELDIFKAYEY